MSLTWTSQSNTSPRTPLMMVRPHYQHPLYYFFAHRTPAHLTDIYSLSTTASQVFSSSGSSSIKIHSINQPGYPLFQALDNAHRLGCHHIATSGDGHVAASVGFGGEAKIWAVQRDGQWSEKSKVVGAIFLISKMSQFGRTDRWNLRRWQQSRRDVVDSSLWGRTIPCCHVFWWEN